MLMWVQTILTEQPEEPFWRVTELLEMFCQSSAFGVCVAVQNIYCRIWLRWRITLLTNLTLNLKLEGAWTVSFVTFSC